LCPTKRDPLRTIRTTSSERITLDVARRRERKRGGTGPGIASEEMKSDLLDELAIPGSTEGGRGWETFGRRGYEEVVAAEAVGAIGHLDSGYT